MASFIVRVIRKLFVYFFRLILSVYFKETTVIGLDNVPSEGPIIFVGNHANQYIDPLSIVAYWPHHICFMVAASTHRQKIMGFFTKLFGAIPVERPQDIAQVGEGKVEFQEGGIVKGHGSKFTKQAMKGDTLKVKGCTDYVIDEVVSDTEMKVKAKEEDQCEYGKPDSYKIAPKVDQSEVFSKVWEELSNGKCLGIFPEGGSHDQTDLLPLKVGVAICALGAMTKYKDTKIKVIACGLKYFHPNRFRSKMIVEFSSPFEVDPKLVQEYQEDKRAACSKFLAQTERKLRSVTFSAPNYKELRAIYLARRLYLPTSEEYKFTEEDINELYKRFFKGYKKMRGEPEVEKLMKEVYSYGAELKSLGIRDSQVFQVEFKFFDLMRKSIVSMIRLTASLLFILPGMITLAPLGILNSFLAERERRRALSKSTVKVVGADVMSSFKIMTSFVLYPLTCSFFTSLLFYIQYAYSTLEIYDILVNCFWFLIFYPIYNYICVRSWDGVIDNYNNLFVRVYCLFSKDTMEHIRAKRAILSKKVKETITKFGPQVFEDFDKMKLVKNLKPKKNASKAQEMDSEVSSQNSFYHMINEIDFDDAFAALTELGL